MGPQSVINRHGANALVFAPLVVLGTIALGTFVLTSWLHAIGSPYMSIAMWCGAALFIAASFAIGWFGFRHLRWLQALGLTDSLTGLPNRRALHNDMRVALDAGEEIGLALLDLDGFKQTNDHHGHNVGDEAIRQTGRILLSICDEEASVFRLGGDEFAILQIGSAAATLIEGHCRRIVERMSEPLEVDDRRLMLGASIGLVRSDGIGTVNTSEMLRRADVAMYASKRGGRMRCTWFNEAFDRSREELSTMNDELRSALAHGQFSLLYQPLVDTETKHIVAVEALLRWDRPDGRPVGPGIFIPIAEESGLINAIGKWVLRQACVDASQWDGIRLSVNISAAQLRNPEFPVQLGTILEETGFDPARLELEITETCLVLDPVVAERSLALIRSFGVSVALDDFGTGYASIGFLRQFRFEKLKLDRSLVVQAGNDDGSRAMMLSSITVARAMKMGVTAEGVETEQQAEMVRAAGCDQIQGWLYFRAMPAFEIAQHLGRPIGFNGSPLATPSPVPAIQAM